jgi:hypothetical protein
MHYSIKVNYQTGDSFHIEEVTDILEWVWHNEDMVNESLERLNNHYKFYCDKNYMYEKPKGKVPKGVVWNNEYRLIMLELIDDDGKPFLYSASWCGYFETLYYAEVVVMGNRYDY